MNVRQERDLLKELLADYSERKATQYEESVKVIDKVKEMVEAGEGSMDELCQGVSELYDLPYDFVFKCIWEMIDHGQLKIGDDRMLVQNW